MTYANPPILSRRAFIVGTGALSVGVSFGAALHAAKPTPLTDVWPAGGLTPNVWVNIGIDGVITIAAPEPEIGQGITTALPLLVAEELDADIKLIRVIQAPVIPAIYGNPALGGSMSTRGSNAVRSYYDELRLAGAQARRVLLEAAAVRWEVPVAQLSTESGTVIHASSKRRIGYGRLAARMKPVTSALQVTKDDLKPQSRLCYVGKDVPRMELPATTDGSALYGIDEWQPGLLYASLVPAPVTGERPLEIDDAAALAVLGVLKVVALANAVGVIAETIEAARRAKILIKIRWTATSKARGYSAQTPLTVYGALIDDPAQAGVDMVRKGDAVAALGRATRTIDSRFFSSNVAHAGIEPLNATARVMDGGVEVWTSTQSPSIVIAACAEAAGVSAAAVKVHPRRSGGAFGRTSDDADHAALAVLLAKAVPGRPVKLILTREDDFAIDKFRPAVAQRIQVGIDDRGELIAFRQCIVAQSHLARAAPAHLAASDGKDGVVAGRSGAGLYAVENNLARFVRVKEGIDVGALRGTAAGYVKFAVESVIDEVAVMTDRDPIDLRLHLLRDEPAAMTVVRTVAEMSDWKTPREGRSLGVAFSDAVCLTATVVEVSLDTISGAIKVHRLWCALDCGIAIQPRNVLAQIEGAIVLGLGMALYEAVQVNNGEVQTRNFHSYRVMRMADMPKIEIKRIETDTRPMGAGEAGVSAVAPAIANAVTRLTGGKRPRSLPMSPESIRAVLQTSIG